MPINFNGAISCPVAVQQLVFQLENTSVDVQVQSVMINGNYQVSFDVPYPISPGGGGNFTQATFNWADTNPINIQIQVTTGILGQSVHVYDRGGAMIGCYDPQAPGPLTFNNVDITGLNPVRIVVQDSACV